MHLQTLQESKRWVQGQIQVEEDLVWKLVWKELVAATAAYNYIVLSTSR